MIGRAAVDRALADYPFLISEKGAFSPSFSAAPPAPSQIHGPNVVIYDTVLLVKKVSDIAIPKSANK